MSKLYASLLIELLRLPLSLNSHQDRPAIAYTERVILARAYIDRSRGLKSAPIRTLSKNYTSFLTFKQHSHSITRLYS